MTEREITTHRDALTAARVAMSLLVDDLAAHEPRCEAGYEDEHLDHAASLTDHARTQAQAALLQLQQLDGTIEELRSMHDDDGRTALEAATATRDAAQAELDAILDRMAAEDAPDDEQPGPRDEEPRYSATLEERGNGWPEVGSIVDDLDQPDGRTYMVVGFARSGAIETQGPGKADTLAAVLQVVDTDGHHLPDDIPWWDGLVRDVREITDSGEEHSS